MEKTQFSCGKSYLPDELTGQCTNLTATGGIQTHTRECRRPNTFKLTMTLLTTNSKVMRHSMFNNKNAAHKITSSSSSRLPNLQKRSFLVARSTEGKHFGHVK
jgi:hypothetical protein